MHTTTGPLGFPQSDDAARLTEVLLRKAVGKYMHAQLAVKTIDIGKRSDISWISTETPDRYNHVVIANGMDAEAYQLNPIVTLNHDYDIPPVGISNWQRQASNGKGVRGVQALTHYPAKPDQFDGPWRPDEIFALVSAGLMNAKSIGFLPLEVTQPGRADEPLIIRRWALLEYAVGTIPVNPDTTVIQVRKTLSGPDLAVSFDNRLAAIDVEKIIQNCLDRMRGLI